MCELQTAVGVEASLRLAYVRPHLQGVACLVANLGSEVKRHAAVSLKVQVVFHRATQAAMHGLEAVDVQDAPVRLIRHLVERAQVRLQHCGCAHDVRAICFAHFVTSPRFSFANSCRSMLRFHAGQLSTSLEHRSKSSRSALSLIFMLKQYHASVLSVKWYFRTIACFWL